MEGDLSDVNWEWHWWAQALQSSIDYHGLAPTRVVPVHGEVLSLEETLAHIDAQAEAAMAACARYAEQNTGFFGCPVRSRASGLLPLEETSDQGN